MELCDIELRLAGNLQHVVPKQDVTPAEILILREIHGPDAVVNIRPKKMDKRSHGAEWERLVARYGKNGQSAGPGGSSVLLDNLFPGAVKRLPVSLAEINASVSEPADAEA